MISALGLISFLIAEQNLAREVVLFGLLCLVAEKASVFTPHATFSVSYVVGVTALVALGPGPAAIAMAFGAFDCGIKARSDWHARFVFNAGQLGLSTAIAGITYVGAGGPVGHLETSDFPRALLALSAQAAVFFLVNCLLVTTIASMVRRLSWREVWLSNFSGIAGSTLAFAMLGLLMSGVYFQIGFWALAFVFLPLLVARRVLQAAGKMDQAYEATLRGLVTAIEAKDAYTRGHAERVSKISVLIAREAKVSERQVRALRIAALMHDVGKLVVSTPILTKPGKLTDDEYEHMKSHPVHGCNVIEEIDFLRHGEAVFAVRHHHERMDGRGYPDGLRGDDVPLTARIVMVADAFDSMTSTRTYRQALTVDYALRELRRCSATQFDPALIAALYRAIRRHGWEPTPEVALPSRDEVLAPTGSF